MPASLFNTGRAYFNTQIEVNKNISGQKFSRSLKSYIFCEPLKFLTTSLLCKKPRPY